MREFDAFAAEWDALNRATFDTPLLDAAFVGAAMEHFGTGNERLAVAEDGQGTVAACVLTVSGPTLATFQPSQLPLGLWLQRPDRALPALAAALMESVRPFALMVSVTQLDPMLLPAPSASALAYLLPHVETGEIDLPEAFDAYMAGRSRNLLSNLRRRARKAEREQGPVSVEVIRDPERALAALALYAEIEGQGWKAGRGTALTPGHEQFPFYAQALGAYCRRGEGRVYLLRFGERVVAAELAIVRGESIYLLKTTHAEQLRACSPGVLLKWKLIESVLRDEARVRRVEIYGPLNDSQKPWITGTRRLYHVNFYRLAPLKTLHVLSSKARRALGVSAPAEVESV